MAKKKTIEIETPAWRNSFWQVHSEGVNKGSSILDSELFYHVQAVPGVRYKSVGSNRTAVRRAWQIGLKPQDYILMYDHNTATKRRSTSAAPGQKEQQSNLLQTVPRSILENVI
jgi:hypothetical protein